ncbi:hypothetical protein H6762_00920 [Candidatus Nomurabacteria bacterium]|uniref:Uncharacterized protein n=1 Tax=Candidatus Dojkabacteria bacterium TaxID=2099670 RepID=A0A955KYK4_9BACT|nr:hypothetical protein [Candidatus Dojkabacteria bacterium]MCB9789539.1 hypothetical protein [Candidatus Nomurabacteria bacterium]
MRRAFLSLLIIGTVSVVAVGATRSFFSDTEQILGNQITTATLDVYLDDRDETPYFGLAFPVELAPGLSTEWTTPNGLDKDQRFEIHLEDGSMTPDHYELLFSTSDFVSGVPGDSTQEDYTKMIEVTKLYAHRVSNSNVWTYQGLMGQIVDHDGDPAFVSLYDLERTIIDNILVGEAYTSIGFELTMSETAGNEFQGDSLNVNMTVGAAQVAGQAVLSLP